MNIRFLFLFVAIVAVSVTSCDMNEVEDVMLLRTDSFSHNSPSHVERWVFISNQKGKLLNVIKPTEESEIIEFKGVADNVIMITELSVASFENGQSARLQHHITTYLGIPVGSSFFAKEEKTNQTPFPDPVGKAKLTLNNYHSSDDPWLSVGFSDGYDGSNSWLDYDTRTYDGSTFMADMNLREDPIDIFITSYKETGPVYSWVRDASVGDSVVVDFETFSPMNTVTVNKPVTNAYIQGQLEPGTAGKGYFLSWSEFSRNSDHHSESKIITLGYTNDFTYYDVYVESGQVLCCEPHERVNYHKVGTSVPQFIHLPDYTFTVANGNLFNLNYSFDQQYTHKNFFFSAEEENNSLWWFFIAPESMEVLVPKIPDEILAKYPFLKQNNLPLKNVSFFEYLDGYSYMDYVRNQLERKLDRDEFEQIQYFFQF